MADKQNFRTNQVQLGEDVSIDPDAVVGAEEEFAEEKQVSIGDGSEVGAYAVIEQGASIGRNCDIGYHSQILYDAELGDDCIVRQRGQVHGNATVGERTVVTGLVCENAEVGDDSRILGELLHSLEEPQRDWDENEESRENAPKLGDYVVVSRGAQVIGDVEIEGPAWMLPGARVTQDMESYSVAVEGTNETYGHEHSEIPDPVSDSGLWNI